MHLIPPGRLLFALALLTLALACGDDRDARLGASGELCLKDADCREELVCERSVCIALGAAGNNDNNPGNNDNNPGNNPGSIEEGCEQLCDRFSACGLGLDADCGAQCLAELGKLGQDGFNDFYACAEAQSCEAILNGGLEVCFDFEQPVNNGSPPPDDRYLSCDFLASYVPELCDDDGISSRLYEDCVLYAAPNLGDGPFYEGISCVDSVDDCGQLIDCIYEAWY